jgi:hypothetical protein
MTDIPIPVDVVLGVSAWAFLSFIYVLFRIAKPLKCECGYRTVFIGLFKRHILMKHRWL